MNETDNEEDPETTCGNYDFIIHIWAEQCDSRGGLSVSEPFPGTSSPNDVIFLFLYTFVRTVVRATARFNNLHDFVFAELFVFELGYQ